MKIRCQLGFHKWERHSPKFPDSNKYHSMSFSVYSANSHYSQYRQFCKNCNKTRCVLEEEMTVGEYSGYKNRIEIPRFTLPLAIQYDIQWGMELLYKEVVVE